LEIRVLHRHGKSIREIAREMGVSRNTVRRYLRDAEAARYKARPPRRRSSIRSRATLLNDYARRHPNGSRPACS
jgi:transposase